MSERKDVILSHMSDSEPMTAAALSVITGLELKAVQNDLFNLKTKGLIRRAEGNGTRTGGYIKADGADPPTVKVQRDILSPPQAKRGKPGRKPGARGHNKAKPPAKKRGRKPKAKRAADVVKPLAPRYAIFGDYIVLQRAQLRELLQAANQWVDLLEAL